MTPLVFTRQGKTKLENRKFCFQRPSKPRGRCGLKSEFFRGGGGGGGGGGGSHSANLPNPITCKTVV